MNPEEAKKLMMFYIESVSEISKMALPWEKVAKQKEVMAHFVDEGFRALKAISEMNPVYEVLFVDEGQEVAVSFDSLEEAKEVENSLIEEGYVTYIVKSFKSARMPMEA